ncbi:MAG: universal stress protein, partial [Nitrospirae bacterium]|nr:universal stress protein [Nitrospirota bacterium]
EERVQNQAVLETKLLLERAGASLGKMGIQPQIHFRLGDPAQEIIDCVREVRADLLVLGTRKHRGAKRFLLGSISARVVELAPCSVLIVK